MNIADQSMLRIYVITIRSPKRPASAIEPMVFTDFRRAVSAFQHQCGSNVSVKDAPGEPTIYEHWRTKVLLRFDTFDLNEPLIPS